jgi:hypothetical protein
LIAEDVFDLNPENQCSHIKKIWNKNWDIQKSKKLKENASKKSKHESADLRMSILPTMYRTYGKLYLSASSLRLIRTLLNVVRT